MSFARCQNVEQRALPYLIKLLEWYCPDGRYVLVNKGMLVPELQVRYGDAFANDSQGVFGSIEFKAEENVTGNLFLETWSNLDFLRAKLGWMYSLKADRLWYYFLNDDVLYDFSFPKLWDWAFVQRRIYGCREVSQRKTAQLNNTCGRLAPIETLRREVGFREFRNLKTGLFFEVTAQAPSGQLAIHL